MDSHNKQKNQSIKKRPSVLKLISHISIITVVTMFFIFSCQDLNDLERGNDLSITSEVDQQSGRHNSDNGGGGGGDDDDGGGDGGDDGGSDNEGGGSVGGTIYSSPGTITMELRWGSNYENSEVRTFTGDGSYSFAADIRNNTLYRVHGNDFPAGWSCRAKQVHNRIDKDAASETNIYCGTSSSSNGVRVATWNLEWYDAEDDPEKKQAIADLINEWNFDVMNLTEVLDDVAVDDLIQNYLGNANNWDYRITDAGCSLKQVTLWNTNAVTFLSGHELNAANSGGFIDETTDTWRDCRGRRPFVANFAVNSSDVEFTTASVHFKAGSSSGDCQIRKDQVDTLVDWIDWAGNDQKDFVVIGDFNDELPGTGICNSINTLDTMESRIDFTFVTAQPDYHYSYMMGNGLVTFDTRSFQSTIDHLWVTNSLFDRLLPDVDTFGNYANTAQANMLFWPWGEPDHNPPYMVIGK